MTNTRAEVVRKHTDTGRGAEACKRLGTWSLVPIGVPARRGAAEIDAGDGPVRPNCRL